LVSQSETRGIVALTAHTQQIFVAAQRQIEFATVHVIDGLPKGNSKEFHGSAQLLPQFS
jgi:hypothetical protein